MAARRSSVSTPGVLSIPSSDRFRANGRVPTVREFELLEHSLCAGEAGPMGNNVRAGLVKVPGLIESDGRCCLGAPKVDDADPRPDASRRLCRRSLLFRHSGIGVIPVTSVLASPPLILSTKASETLLREASVVQPGIIGIPSPTLVSLISPPSRLFGPWLAPECALALCGASKSASSPSSGDVLIGNTELLLLPRVPYPYAAPAPSPTLAVSERIPEDPPILERPGAPLPLTE